MRSTLASRPPDAARLHEEPLPHGRGSDREGRGSDRSHERKRVIAQKARKQAGLLIMFALLGRTGPAQPAAPALVGTWHNTAASPIPQTLLIFSADGYYAEVAVPPGRKAPKNEFDHRTREELMKQFGGLRASYGTWKAEGTKLTRLLMASEDPAKEGTQRVAEFRFEGDVLILKAQNGQSEGRFRRVK